MPVPTLPGLIPAARGGCAPRPSASRPAASRPAPSRPAPAWSAVRAAGWRIWLAALLWVLAAGVASAEPVPSLPAPAAEAAPADPALPAAPPSVAAGVTGPEAAALARILADEAARSALIAELNRLAGAVGTDSAAAGDTVGEAVTDPDTSAEAAALDADPADQAEAALEGEQASLARRIGALTRAMFEQSYDAGERLVRRLRGLADAGRLNGSVAWDFVLAEALSLGLLIVITIAVFRTLRLGARIIDQRLARSRLIDGLLGHLVLLVAAVVIDVLTIALTWGIGYGVALTLLGDPGQVGVRHSLYLNAFLEVETIKVVVRMFFAPFTPGLRLIPLGDRAARMGYLRTALVISLVGYGVLVAVPILDAAISRAFGTAILVLVLIAAAVVALVSIWGLRRVLRAEGLRRKPKSDWTGQILRVLGQVWPWLASLYVVCFRLIALVSPGATLPDLMAATGASILAVILGAIAIGLLGRVIRRGVRLPDALRQKLPLLERRTNAVIPNVLRVLRLVVVLAVMLAILDIWGLLAVDEFLESPRGLVLLGSLLAAGLIVAVCFALWLAFSSWVEYRLSPVMGTLPSARERTLLALLSNAVTVTLIDLGTMLALSEIGIDIGPLLAGAGVLGLAIGFGGQKLVQDVITGAFIQLENAINEGDVIQVAGIGGVVEKLTLRSVSLRDLSGTLFIIPFSSVDTVANYMRGYAYHLAEIGIDYDDPIADCRAAMQEAFQRVKDSPVGSGIIGDYEMHGVIALGDSSIVVRSRIKALPGKQWEIGRLYTEMVKIVFDERGLSIPFPHRTLVYEQAVPVPPLSDEEVAQAVERAQTARTDDRRQIASAESGGEG